MLHFLGRFFFFFFFLMFSFHAVAAELPLELGRDGFHAKINEAKGKVVVVNIFASWCPPCRDEIPGIVAVRNTFSDAEVFITGISVDEPIDTVPNGPLVSKALNVFVENMTINYPIFIANESLLNDLQPKYVPQLYVYDQNGTLVKEHVGYISQGELEQIIVDLLAKGKS